ncbi:MAG: tripartite tricarboxylate transporter substrate binding protein [Burkholderiales bacterium]|nr:tripartite tricarboxylate transporter substrate binding protein [Burkholderiales bacterium]
MKQVQRCLIAVGMFALAGAAAAQGKFPDGPVKMIVPFAPGGGVDGAGRLIARQLQAGLNVPVVVENRAGASGTIGGRAVHAAAADGQTLLFSASTHVLANQVLAAPPYDPVGDFAAVARVGEAPLLMVIAPNLPQRNLGEVLAAVRQRPEQWVAALPALGAASHLATLLLAKQGNLTLTMTPYKGTAPALTDVAGGHVQILVDSIISLSPLAKGGKVKAIASTGAKRASVMPDVPTAAESGLPGLVYSSWYGVWAPKSTAPERVQLLNKAFNQAVADLTKSGALAQIGVEPVTESVEQFRKFIAADVAQAGDLLKGAGFKPE